MYRIIDKWQIHSFLNQSEIPNNQGGAKLIIHFVFVITF